MANFYQDNEDLKFYVEHYIDWQRIVELVELHYKAEDAPKTWQDAVATYQEVINLFGEFVANEVAPRAAAIDREEIHVANGKVTMGQNHQDIFDLLREMGVYGMSVPRELGGMNLPVLVYFMAAEVFARADVSSMTHFSFHAGIATALVQYSIAEKSATIDAEGRVRRTRFDDAIQEILAGKAWGSMDLTEPEAGSDLAALRTRATRVEDGTWRITGNKIFITSGHGKYHLVLAKTEDREALDALSLFLVPLEYPRSFVDSVEEKLGHHGSATCSVQFDNAKAELIGKPGEGFKHMLLMMNGARLGVGFEGVGLCEAAYRQALAYAEERQTFGKPIAQHERIADMLEDMDITIKGLRALTMEGGISEEQSSCLQHLLDAGVYKNGTTEETKRELRRYRSEARRLTPLIKYAASEAAVRLTRMNMQIHGGNGYMKDYAAERLMRDALVLPVYEGTSQIQALMVFRDHMLKVVKAPQKFMQRLAQAKLNAVRSRDPLERAYFALRSLAYSAEQHILLHIAKKKWSSAAAGPLPSFLTRFLKDWDPKKDFSFGLLHAENLMQILIDVETVRVLLKQAQKFPERREVLERFLERAEPRVRYHWDLICHTGERLAARLEKDAVILNDTKQSFSQAPL